MSALIAVLLLLFSLSAEAVTMPVALAHTLYSSNRSDTYYNNDLYTKWEIEPAAISTGLYAGSMFYFQNGVGGYMGMQVDPQSAGGKKKIIFSIWDSGTTVITARPTGSDTCVRFGHEGSGTSCISAYNWVAGREYRLRIWMLNRVNNATSWGAWIQDTTTGVDTQIGTILLSDSAGYQGYGFLVPGVISFTEHYGGDGSDIPCASLPYASVTRRGPYWNNGTVGPENVAIAEFNIPTCLNSNESAIQIPFVTQEVGGTTVRTLNNKTNLWTTLSGNMVTQTISFGSATSMVVETTGTVSASATSGLPVTFSSATPSVCTVTGSTVAGIMAGTCTVIANQAGNAGYSAATQVTQSIQVKQLQYASLVQTISAIKFSPAELKVGATTVVSANATSGLPVSFSSVTRSICTIAASQSSLLSPITYTISGVVAGICTIAANQNGGVVLMGGTYGAAPQVTRNIIVTVSQSDCIFNWAERTYPQFFSPAGASSAIYAPYYYRYYSGTGNYLASTSAESHLWAVGAATGGNMLDLGPLANFSAAAGCQ